MADHFETEFGTKNYFGGDGNTTFAVPNLQGEFLRCTGTNSHTDQGNGGSVGVHQDGTISNSCWAEYGLAVSKNAISYTDAHVDTYTLSSYVSAVKSGENTGPTSYKYTSRPTNTSVWYMIKY